MTRPSVILFAIWCAIIAFASLQPRRPDWTHASGGHRISHIVCFGILTAFAALAFSRRRLFTIAVPGCILFGAALELAQRFIFSISLEWSDIRDDTIGVLLVVAFLIATSRPRLPHPVKELLDVQSK
jgi:hypothetical protein